MRPLILSKSPFHLLKDTLWGRKKRAYLAPDTLLGLCTQAIPPYGSSWRCWCSCFSCCSRSSSSPSVSRRTTSCPLSRTFCSCAPSLAWALVEAQPVHPLASPLPPLAHSRSKTPPGCSEGLWPGLPTPTAVSVQLWLFVLRAQQLVSLLGLEDLCAPKR